MSATAQVMEDAPEFTFAQAPAEILCPSARPGEGRSSPEDRIKGGLRERIGEERFDLSFGSGTRFCVSNGCLKVAAANAFLVRRISSKFRTDLLAAAQDVLGPGAQVAVDVGEDMPADSRRPDEPAAPRHAGPAQPLHAAALRRPASAEIPINPRFTLDEFVPGPSNQLAHRAACQVADFPAQQFNPLFIHGHCGLGKTHLLQGICHRFAARHPGKKWLYLTGEQFTNDFLEALAQKRASTLRRRIRNADLLVIDDVHFIAGKKATQEEFLHTFNQVDGCGKQIVLASDCAPRQIQHLSEQLCSRFVSGMVLRVDSPDLPTRLEILRRRAARHGWNLTDAVLMHIAKSAASSVRELEGMLLQVVAGISLMGTGDAAGAHVLASIRERSSMPGPVAVEKIIAATAEHFSLTPEAITGQNREKIISVARAAAMHLARRHTGMSFPEIGRAFGGKNHSTVIAACQRIEGLIAASHVLFWNTPAGPRHQAITDALSDLETAIRRA